MKTALTNALLFIGNGEVPEKGTVIVEDNLIKEILPISGKMPTDAHKIDLSQKTLFPGFIDCHVHLCLDGSADPMRRIQEDSPAALALKVARHAKDTLMAGVTTVRDMGGSGFVDLAARDAIKAGLIPGPRILSSGRVVCISGGHGWLMGGREADGPDEVRQAAREQIKAGCDIVKLMATGGVLTQGVEPGSPQLTLDELKAGIEEAHKAGRRTAAHAQGLEGILNALHAGIDSIEHGIFLNDEAIQLMKERGVPLIPTLTVGLTVLARGEKAGIPKFAVEKTARVMPTHLKNMRKAYEAGITIAAGTDAGTPFNPHGNNLAEINNLAGNGLSAMEALCAATGIAAGVLGLEDEIGMIRPGLQADLVAVSGNPLEDLEILKSPQAISMVMKGGEIVKLV